MICRATPRATSIMPSVAIKGGRPILVIQMPLTHPHTPPTSTPASMAIGTGTPILTSKAATTPESASTEPTDKSMPPVMITHVAATPR